MLDYRIYRIDKLLFQRSHNFAPRPRIYHIITQKRPVGLVRSQWTTGYFTYKKCGNWKCRTPLLEAYFIVGAHKDVLVAKILQW